MSINRVKHPNQFFLDFDEENQFIVNINGYHPMYKLSDLIRLRDMIETSMQTYIEKDISDEVVDSSNKEHVQEYYLDCFDREIPKTKKEPIIKKDYLYLFFDYPNQKLKIGRSENPKKRRNALQYEFNVTLTPLFEIENCGEIEAFVLNKFSNYCLHGEWFSYQREIIDYFQDLKSVQENDKA